jgi:hypothetical protein
VEAIDTGVQCRVCSEGKVIAEINFIPTVSEMDMPVGPESASYYRKVVKFHCGECGVAYHHPPGKPDAASDILSEISMREEEERSRPTEEAFSNLRREVLIANMLDRMKPIPENASDDIKKALNAERETIVKGTLWRTMPLDQLEKLSKMEMPSA